MKIDIIKIGNSKGIRLPKAVLEQCGFGDQVELEVRAGEVVLRVARRHPRDGWEDAFQSAADNPEPESALGRFLDLANEFDETEWTWDWTDELK